MEKSGEYRINCSAFKCSYAITAQSQKSRLATGFVGWWKVYQGSRERERYDEHEKCVEGITDE